jgi:hypothetical protein
MRPVLIPRCDGVGKPLKKTHTRSGGTGVRTRDLPNAKWRARRLATVLGRERHSSLPYVTLSSWEPGLPHNFSSSKRMVCAIPTRCSKCINYVLWNWQNKQIALMKYNWCNVNVRDQVTINNGITLLTETTSPTADQWPVNKQKNLFSDNNRLTHTKLLDC